MSVCNKSDTSVERFCEQFPVSELIYWTNKKYLWLRVHYNLMWCLCFMIPVHFLQLQNRTLTSFSEWSVLMNKCRPEREVWRVFQLFLTSRLSWCVNSKQQFNIIGVHSFLNKYFSLIFVFIPLGFFFNNKKCPHWFFLVATGLCRPPVLISILR